MPSKPSGAWVNFKNGSLFFFLNYPLIKIDKNKNFKTLKGIYNAIIGSIFTYSFFAVARIETNLDRLQRVLNRAI